MNTFLVSKSSTGVVIISNLPSVLTNDEALNLAVYLLLLCGKTRYEISTALAEAET